MHGLGYIWLRAVYKYLYLNDSINSIQLSASNCWVFIFLSTFFFHIDERSVVP